MCKIFWIFLGLLSPSYFFAQETKSAIFLKELLVIENSEASDIEKLAFAEKVKKKFELSVMEKDSVYARILHKMAVWQFYGANDANTAIINTKESIEINLNKNVNSSPRFAAYSYFNLGVYYESLQLFSESLKVLDSAIVLVKNNKRDNDLFYKAALVKGQIFFATGNYQKSIDALSAALTFQKGNIDPEDVASIYIERAFSKINLGLIDEALNDIEKSEIFLQNNPNSFQRKADIFKAKAFAWENRNNNDSALLYYKLAQEERIVNGNKEALANELSDLGVFFSNSLKDYDASIKYYNQALSLALKNGYTQTLINLYINIADFNIRRNLFFEALKNSQTGLKKLIPRFESKQIFSNPKLSEVLSCHNYYSAYALMANKAEALLLGFLANRDIPYIKAALETFVLNDKIIDELRRGQNSLNGQLFWQRKTRNFYRLAIEASYLANDPAGMLYFMEKSRAVLLNDKLNELGSLAYLPAAEAEQEQQLRINIASLEKQNQALTEKGANYEQLSKALLKAREDFNQFIKTLETKFPVYYQYKYNNSVPSIHDIRDKLLNNGQVYLSFFETDSVVYSLLISKNDVQFKKVLFPGYAATVKTFTELCKNRTLLNANYKQYANLSHLLYQKLIAPLNLPKGKVIVSPDLNFMPMEALTKDSAGKSFLLYDYSFDYTYSAGYLIKASLRGLQGDAGFLGIAPESFAPNLSLAKLYGSVASLESIYSTYGYGQILKYNKATRHFFLNNAGGFTLLHLYAHAKSDNDAEPVLYMSDSAISVSELSQWSKPQVALAFLAACETGAGELYMGEGINSIARSFAAIGVPSTIATLWKADNKAMYAISERFYYYLNQGLTKDEALQKAKIDFINSGSGENKLPYYWASAVLSGNAMSVELPSQNGFKKYWTIVLLIPLTIIAIYYKRKSAAGKRD